MRLLAATLPVVSRLSAGAVGQDGAECGPAYKRTLITIERTKPQLSAQEQPALERVPQRL